MNVIFLHTKTFLSINLLYFPRNKDFNSWICDIEKIWENIVSLRKNCPTQFIVIWIIISFILGCMRKRINYRQVLLKSWHWGIAILSKKYEKYQVLYSVSNHWIVHSNHFLSDRRKDSISSVSNGSFGVFCSWQKYSSKQTMGSKYPVVWDK